VRFPPVRYCQISSATAETVLYSRFGGHNGGVVKGEKRKRTNLILLANQGDSPGQPKKVLAWATAIRYNYYVQLVAIKRSRMHVANLIFRSARQKGGVKLVVRCTVTEPELKYNYKGVVR